MKLNLTILFCLFAFSGYSQQAWNKKKGSGYFQVGGSSLTYDGIFDNNFERVELGRKVNQTIIAGYGEYGFSDKLMGTVFIPYQMVSTGELNPEYTGIALPKSSLGALGNVDLALTYNLFKKNSLTGAAKLGFMLPTASEEESSGLRTGYDANAIKPSFLLGKGTAKYFSSIEAGVKIFNNDFPAQLQVDFQLGKKFLKSKKLFLILGLNSVTMLGGERTAQEVAEQDGNSIYTGLYLSNTEYYTWNFKAGYKLPKNFYLWASMGGGTAKNVGLAPVLTFSLGYGLNE